MSSDICITCGNRVRPRQEALQCETCLKWNHRTCGTGISRQLYRRLVKGWHRRINDMAGDEEPENKSEESLLINDSEKICNFNISNKDVDKKESEQTLQEPCIVPSSQDISGSDLKTEKNVPNAETNIRLRASKNTVKIHQPQSDRLDTGKLDSRSRTSKDVSSQSFVRSPEQQLELLRIVSCVFVAILSRMVLQLGYGLLYFQSIVAQFVVLEAALFYYKKTYLQNVSLPQQAMTKYMSGVLLLCGIRSNIINTYSVIMANVTAVMEDFSVYIFAFVICHLMITT